MPNVAATSDDACGFARLRSSAMATTKRTTPNGAGQLGARLIAALVLRYRLLPRAPRGMCGEGTVPGVIAYDWSAGRELRGLLVMHGVAHQLLLTQPEPSNECDAWLLTAALLLLACDLHRAGRAVFALAHAPGWFVAAVTGMPLENRAIENNRRHSSVDT